MNYSKEYIIAGLRQLLEESEAVQATVHNTGSFGDLREFDSSCYNAWRIKALPFIRTAKIEIPDIIQQIEIATKAYY